MIDTIRREWVYLWYYFTLQLRQILPYYVLGIILGSVISVFAVSGFCDGIFTDNRSDCQLNSLKRIFKDLGRYACAAKTDNENGS